MSGNIENIDYEELQRRALAQGLPANLTAAELRDRLR